MAIKPSPRSDARSHNQVMTTPSPSTLQKPGITPPGPKLGGTIGGPKPNSPGIKPKGSKNGMC